MCTPQVVTDIPAEHVNKLKKVYRTNALQNKALYDGTFDTIREGMGSPLPRPAANAAPSVTSAYYMYTVPDLLVHTWYRE